MHALYPDVFAGPRAMLFVDGENFAIRYGEMLGAWKEARGDKQSAPQPADFRSQPGGVWYEPNVALWAQCLNLDTRSTAVRLVRRYYYTSVAGDEPERQRIEQWLKDRGFEAPRVFHRDKNRGSKQVDISLTTEMLTHAHRRHYDTAILIAGDADYCPLVRAVKAEGARVHVWAFSKGLSPKLKLEADHFVQLDEYFGL
jgi:uncharacterized LabA/DUF88 family protein